MKRLCAFAVQKVNGNYIHVVFLGINNESLFSLLLVNLSICSFIPSRSFLPLFSLLVENGQLIVLMILRHLDFGRDFSFSLNTRKNSKRRWNGLIESKRRSNFIKYQYVNTSTISIKPLKWIHSFFIAHSESKRNNFLRNIEF